MTKIRLIEVGLAGLVILLGILIGLLRLRRRVKPAYFQAKWRELQQFCKSKETWALAIINADQLLDEALKKRHMKGRSMGERLVSAQRQFTNNDAIWYAHNLSKKLLEEQTVRLKQIDVKNALVGIRQALKDLGAME